MLDTTVYDNAMELYVQNFKSAGLHGDFDKQEQSFVALMHVIKYAASHGLSPTTQGGRFYFKHGYTDPAALKITTKFQKGRVY